MSKKPSDSWKPVNQALEIWDEIARTRIESFVRGLNFDKIKEYATTLHPNRATCSINESVFTLGQTFVVFEIVFSDGLLWIIRLKMPNRERQRSSFLSTTECEIATLRLIRERTSIPVPQVMAFASSPAHSPLGKEGPLFVIVTPLFGRTLSQWDIVLDVPETYDTKKSALWSTNTSRK
jgi:hypothetical protein